MDSTSPTSHTDTLFVASKTNRPHFQPVFPRKIELQFVLIQSVLGSIIRYSSLQGNPDETVRVFFMP